jgi:VIT1/CCC1 family predicted Fe2+/Mn2+ transporter
MATQYDPSSSGTTRVTETVRPANGHDADSTVSLLRRLMDEITTLFRQEVQLATSEISRSVTSAKSGVTSVATGGAVLFGGFLALIAAAIIGLSNVVEPWLAALIVGVVVGIVGYVMLSSGRRKLDPAALKPVHTQESLRRGKEVFGRRAP